MSAGRKHRRSTARGWAEEALRRSAEAPAVPVGSIGGFEVVVKGEALYLLARPTAEMPEELAAALRLRNKATMDGVCACGGRQHVGAVRRGHIGEHAFMHDEGCQASDRAIETISKRVGWDWRP